MISPHASFVHRVIVWSAPYVPPSVAVHRRPAGTAASAAGGGAAAGGSPAPCASSVPGFAPGNRGPTPLPSSGGGASHEPPDGKSRRGSGGALDCGSREVSGSATTPIGAVVAEDVTNPRARAAGCAPSVSTSIRASAECAPPPGGFATGPGAGGSATAGPRRALHRSACLLRSSIRLTTGGPRRHA